MISISALLTRAVVNLTSARIMSSPKIAHALCPRPSLLPTTQMQSVTARSLASRDNCSKTKMPKCSKENLANSDCMKKKQKARGKKDSPFKSMWYNPECCFEHCPNVLPRFDELYYKITDKAKRKYQQTWVECPRLKIKKKPICCFDQLKMPKMKKRRRKDRPKTACSMAVEEECSNNSNKKCKKIKMPRCRGVRDPPKCKKERGPSGCKKICAPYPSFSECRKPKRRPLTPVECNCLKAMSLCEAWMHMVKLTGRKK